MASYGNIEGYGRHVATSATYHTLPATNTTSPQHYGSHTQGSHASQHYASHGKKNVKTAVHTISNNIIKEDVPLLTEETPPPLPPEREDVPPPLPPGREDVPPPLPPGREDVPPPLPPGREDVPPPLPPGREEFSPLLPPGKDDVPPPLPPGRDVPPPLPPGREEFSPPLPTEREDVPPPLPPGRPEENPPHGAPLSSRIKQQGFGFPISPADLQQKVHSNGGGAHHGKWRDHKLDKRDSGNVSGDGTVFHHSRPHHVIKVMSKSAPSSCEGQFSTRSDEGYPTSTDSSPSNSGGGTVSHGNSTKPTAGDHLHFKCVMFRCV